MGAEAGACILCRMLLYVLAADSGMMVLDVERGEPVAKEGWLRPKNQSPALGLTLLQASGGPLPPLGAATSLPWAHNDAHADAAFDEPGPRQHDPSDSGDIA